MFRRRDIKKERERLREKVNVALESDRNALKYLNKQKQRVESLPKDVRTKQLCLISKSVESVRSDISKKEKQLEELERD